MTSLAQRTDALEVSAGPPIKAGADSTKAGANVRKAGLYTYSVARVDGDLAEAIKTELLTAQVATNTASVQVTQRAMATLDGKVSSSYVVRTQISVGGVPYAAGFAVGVDYSGGMISSQFIVNAGTFAVIDASASSSNAIYPFVVRGNQTFISQALIGDGWITNAMIGDYIQSTDYVPGQRGWRISKSGNSVEINGSDGRGRLVITNTLVLVYDANGTLRVRMGLWG